MFKKTVDSITANLTTMVKQLDTHATEQSAMAVDHEVKMHAAKREASRANTIRSRIEALLS
jgi:hypothetical protein